ncbi:hypothetical protein ACLB2K_049282 [Fragaria x ananassa]
MCREVGQKGKVSERLTGTGSDRDKGGGVVADESDVLVGLEADEGEEEADPGGGADPDRFRDQLGEMGAGGEEEGEAEGGLESRVLNANQYITLLIDDVEGVKNDLVAGSTLGGGGVELKELHGGVGLGYMQFGEGGDQIWWRGRE